MLFIIISSLFPHTLAYVMLSLLIPCMRYSYSCIRSAYVTHTLVYATHTVINAMYNDGPLAIARV